MITAILVELVIAFLAGVAFIIFYAVGSEWRSTAMGRHVMAFVVATVAEIGGLIALALGVSVPLVVWLIIFGLIDVVMVQRLLLLLRAQHRVTMGSTSPYQGVHMKAHAKAIVAAIVAGLTAVVTGLDDNAVSMQEGIAAVIAFLTALGVTWAVPNKPDHEVAGNRYPR